MKDVQAPFLLLQWPCFFPTSLSFFYLSFTYLVELKFQTTKHLIFDLPSNLRFLRTIAMPILANNLSAANDGFDHAVLTKETIGVSVSGIIEFQNRNRVISTLESYQGIYVSFGRSFSYQNLTAVTLGKSFLELDIASYESARLKFQ